MVGTILVPLSGSISDKAVLEGAHLAAQLFDSHIECLYVRPDAEEMLAPNIELDMGVPVMTPDLWTAMEKADNVRKLRAQNIFDEFCNQRNVAVGETPWASNGVTAAWLETSGDVVHEIVRFGRVSEMIFLGRGSELTVSQGQIGAVLVGCGRPLVLVPRQVPPTFATTVAIAWKDTAEAARALTAAMPFLTRAKKIVVLSADEGGRSVAKTIESAERLVRTLRWDRVHTELRRLIAESVSVPEQLLNCAYQEQADLLVMGGYSHSRARELIFGGFTRHVLNDASLPVLLCH